MRRQHLWPERRFAAFGNAVNSAFMHCLLLPRDALYAMLPAIATRATAAAEQGRLEILQWIYEKCAIMPRDVGLKAAHRGHIPILEFALRSGLKMTKYTARFAVYSGQLNVLRWLVEVAKVSIEEDDEIVALAATYGHIPILEYAVLDKRCTCDHAAYRYVRARAKDQPDVLRWIDEHADMLCNNIR